MAGASLVLSVTVVVNGWLIVLHSMVGLLFGRVLLSVGPVGFTGSLPLSSVHHN